MYYYLEIEPLVQSGARAWCLALRAPKKKITIVYEHNRLEYGRVEKFEKGYYCHQGLCG